MIKKPNILLFITHDQGQYIGCYESPENPVSLETPNIDRIAKNGVCFINHFCTAPQCSPSRASIQSGKYPHQNGVMGLIDQGWDVRRKEQLLIPNFLNEIGYSTHLIGFEHFTNKPKKIGYTSISKRKKEFGYSASFMEKKYLKFLRKHSNEETPFYLQIGTPESHRPFQLFAEPIKPNLIEVPPYFPDTKSVRKELGEFFGTIKRIDKTIGKIYEFLENSGLVDNTLFIYTTDHGIDMPKAKCTLYDPGIKTSLLMSWPQSNLFSGGKRIESLVSNIDLFPSLIDLLGGDKYYENIEGKSFIPLLKGEVGSIRNQIHAEKTYHVIYDPIRCVRSERYKYIKNFEGSRRSHRLFHIPTDTFSYKSKKSFKNEYIGDRPREELYDLEIDPFERNNLADNSDYKGILNDLRKKLDNWMTSTNDPLLYGKVKPPVNYFKKRTQVFRNVMRKDLMFLLERMINYKPFRKSIRKTMKYFA
ncbi:MAG: sulfatase-like hydrolase/transferase [Candidatus Lokiarchaeota archaeon]|nr:sulfatase-like hydrolase/transferase [Candidatus Lokiarchaeota archaeon]